MRYCLTPLKRGMAVLASIAVLILSIGCSPASQSPSKDAAAPPSPVASVDDLWSLMRSRTGYVVLLRHAQTTPGAGDPPGFQLNDCSTQRNLSDEGRKQAVRIGQVFRNRKIPILQVFSSQYCRCLETAQLLNLGDVELFPALNSIFEDRTTATEQTQQVRQQILNHQNTSGVIVMVSHFANIGDVGGVSPQPGEAVVMRANPQGELEIVGQIQKW
jgi:phosphohistidine phosphatase SixA